MTPNYDKVLVTGYDVEDGFYHCVEVQRSQVEACLITLDQQKEAYEAETAVKKWHSGDMLRNKFPRTPALVNYNSLSAAVGIEIRYPDGTTCHFGSQKDAESKGWYRCYNIATDKAEEAP